MSVDAVLIAGPTASGKSAAALALAERAHGVVINTDSMQVYREARILTARPDADAEAHAPHRLYGHVSVTEAYSVARYQADAAAALAEACAKRLLPIFTGGTGMYFGALTEGLADIPAVPPGIRNAAAARRDEIGAEAFHAELAERDPEIAQRLRALDTQRVLRAYEVFEASGRPLSAWQRSKPIPGPLVELKLARFVVAPPRPELHRRIDERFVHMLAAGAVEEAARLSSFELSKSAAKILGLRELQAVSTGRMAVDEARSTAQAATRQYAKRQLTWFRHRMKDWTWLEPSGNFLTEIFTSVT
ncbi:MAG TPA: tRNA (adenosine(37)-N6)-dimethylallyltransferase MiaA [Rhizomicrobium sp.]|nr:tRNA (adenosine(37)-N6)-dimethylallyltransferase MiaA [Rhizomicrobium sp.]